MILGLTGTNTVGKAAAATYFISKGFAYHSHWDVVREELGKLGKEDTYENLTRFDELARKKYGDSYWVKRLLGHFKEEHILIDGISYVEEVEELRRHKSFFLIGVYAPAEVKLDRAYALDRVGALADGKPKKKSLQEKSPATEPEREQLELSKVMQMIDFSVINDAGVTKVYNALDAVLRKILKK